MSEFDPIQFVDTQRRDWNRVAPAWEKWDAALDASLSVCNHKLVDKARIAQGHRVLDLGSGTGFPALLAAQRVGHQGNVIGLDLAEEMLQVARRKAKTLGLPHVTFQNCDVASIPFDDTRFDAVTSRFCLMFLPHLDKTLREIFRVLKPGGNVAAAVWAAPEKNPYLALPMGILKEFCEIPIPDPAAPGIFRLAKPGDLADRMRSAGFSEVLEEEVAIEGVFASGEEYLACLKEMAAPLQAVFAKIPQDQCKEADARLHAAAESFRKGDTVRIPGIALVVSGKK
jgi:ubiquinone/menaquinone biosynthesis C-methylase UbiE